MRSLLDFLFGCRHEGSSVIACETQRCMLCGALRDYPLSLDAAPGPWLRSDELLQQRLMMHRRKAQQQRADAVRRERDRARAEQRQLFPFRVFAGGAR